MTLFSNLYELVLWPGKRDFARTLNEAQLRLNAVVAAGNEVDASIIMPILAARDACKQGNVDPSMESLFYAAYAKLSENAKKVPGLIHAVRVDLQDPADCPIRLLCAARGADRSEQGLCASATGCGLAAQDQESLER